MSRQEIQKVGPAFLAWLLLLVASGGAQQAPQVAPEDAIPLVFGEVLDVRVVNVEVVVTDKQGVRVRNLRPEDFRLRVDGEIVPVDYFSEVLGGTVVAEGGDAAVQGVPALQPGRPVGTSFLVFIDEVFSIARDRNRVLKNLEEQVARLTLEDRMAIVAYDGKELEMLTSWTNSERVLTNALREARDRKTTGLHRMGELRRNDDDRRVRREMAASVTAALEEVIDGPAGSDIVRLRLDAVEIPYATRLATQLERSVDAAVATLRGFAGPQGRKVMLLMAGGWPYSPAQYTVNDFEASFIESASGSWDSRVKGAQDLFGPLSDTANLLGFTLYPVDMPGMQRESRDASYGAAPAGAGSGFYPREDQIHASLLFLADETGGEAMINSQRDHAFDRVVDDTRSYYWLGFTPERSANDASHDIKVEVLRPGLRVRSRGSYLDFSRESEITMMVESSLLFGSPPSTTPLELHFGKPEKSGMGKITLPLEVGIPLDEVTLLPVGNRFASQLEVRVTVMDQAGNRSDTPVAKVDIVGDRLPQPGQHFTWVTGLELRRRKHRVVVAVWDPVSGNIMSSSIEVQP